VLLVQGGNGQDTTGTTGQAGGAGSNITLQGGNGGAASSGSTTGAGGNITLSAGAAGTGTGTAGAAGSVIVKNQSNSTTAFQIQNASSASVLAVDTTNGAVNINGSQFIQNTVAATDILTLQEAASQSGNLIRFNDSTGAQIGKIDSTGAVQLKSFKALATGSQLGNTNNYFSTSSNSSAVVEVQGHSSSQTGNLVELWNSSNNPLTTFNANGDLTIGGSNSVASGSALLVQSTSNAALLTANTSAMRVSIGSIGTPTGQLYVSGTLPTTNLGSVSTGATAKPAAVYVQGKYAYIADNNINKLQIVDISNPASPVSISNTTANFGPNGVFVQGHYAYVTVGSSLLVFDVSNPFAPTQTGSISTGTNTNSIYVQGKYAYILNTSTNNLKIVDVSNPASMSIVGSTATSSFNNPQSVYVQGKYAYVASRNNGQLFAVDVSNPASPSVGTSVSGLGDPQNVYVQGDYAYAVDNINGMLRVVNITNPGAMVLTTSFSLGNSPVRIYAQGRYAYVANLGGDSIQIIDISSPGSPLSVGSVSVGIGNAPSWIFVSGRYAYVTLRDGSALQTYDLGGTYTQQLEAGGAEFGTLQVNNNASFAADASIQGGLQIGQSLQVSSSISTASSLTVGTGLVFGNSSNTNTVTLSAGTTSGSYSLSLPTSAPGTSQCLQTDSVDATKLVFIGCTGGSGSGVTSVGGIDGGTYSDNGAYIDNTANTIYLQSATGSHTGLVTHSGSQTFGGDKTFSGTATVDTSSSTAFVIQNTSSNVLFTADTSSMALSLGVSNTKLGYTTQGGTNDSADRNHVDAMRFSSGTGGSVTSVSVYVGSIDPTTANDKYEVAIYSDSGGAISGAALATSAQGTLVANSWNTISISASLTANTPYWIAYNTNASGNSYNNLIYDSSVAGSVVAYMTQTYGTWPTITTGTATPAPGYAFSMYATITPSTTGAIHTNSAGNTTFTGNVGIGIAPDASTLTGNALNVGGSASITDDSNPQLTLLQSAGNKTTLQTDSSGNFALTSSGTTITLQSSATTTTVVNDGFTAGSLDAAWTVTAPAGATATYDNTGTGHEDLSLIANSNDDCWSTGFNCATVLRTYTDVDRTYEVKIDSMTLPSGSGNSEGMGIMLYGDNNNFIRFELRGSTSGNSVTCYVIIGGVGYTNACQQTNFTVTNPLYLRIVNTGNNYYEYVSQDGSTWTLVNQMNDIQVGGSALTVTKAGFYIDGGSTSKASSGNFDYFKTTALVNPLTLQVNGNISAEGTITTGADYAEYYKQATPGQLNVGDLACLAGPQTVAACGPGGTIVGAVSAHPGYIGNSKAYDKDHPENTALVGMMGQIPVKYDTSGGTINIGDPIGISTTAGVATKEVGAGQIVGYALENSTNTSGGTIMVLVRPQYYTPANSDTLQGGNALFNQITISGTANFGGDINVSGAAIVGTLKVTGDATVGGDLTINGKTIVKDLIINGHLITGGNAPALTADGAAIGHFGVVTLNGNDTAGTITVRVDIDGDGDPDKSTPVDLNGDGKPDPLPTLTAGQLFTVTFNKPYDTGSTPRIVISPANADAAHVQIYVDGGDSPNTHFDLWSLQSLQDGQTYVFNYFVIQ
jgi:cytoskeletal protein CcmA (bactofilin family)